MVKLNRKWLTPSQTNSNNISKIIFAEENIRVFVGCRSVYRLSWTVPSMFWNGIVRKVFKAETRGQRAGHGNDWCHTETNWTTEIADEFSSAIFWRARRPLAALPVYSPAPLASGAEKQAKEEQAVPFSLSGWERNFQNDDIQPITRARRPLAALPVYSPVPLASGTGE